MKHVRDIAAVRACPPPGPSTTSLGPPITDTDTEMMFSAAATLALRPTARMVPSTARIARATMATMSGNPTAKCTTSMGEFTVELVPPSRRSPCITAVPWRHLARVWVRVGPGVAPGFMPGQREG